MSARRVSKILSQSAVRLVMLAALVGLSGVVLGFAVGYPLGRIKFSESNAIRLDQSRLAGTVDPEKAVTEQTDLPLDWEPGKEEIAAFGILGNDFCGEEVALPKALSPVESSVFKSGQGSHLISQAVRVEQWQSAREYIRSVKRALDGCSKFFQASAEGKRVRIDIKDGDGEAPITDFVSRRFVSSVGSDVQSWSIMAVGDVLIGTRYVGQRSPQRSFLSDVENEILMRVAPATFAAGEGDTESDPRTQTSTTETTAIQGGAADETPGAQGGADDSQTPSSTPGD